MDLQMEWYVKEKIYLFIIIDIVIIRYHTTADLPSSITERLFEPSPCNKSSSKFRVKARVQTS